MTSKNYPVRKKDGSGQRADTALTDKQASALVEKIFRGEALFKEYGKPIELTYKDENGETVTEELGYHTLSSWIKRDNVVPSTGETLRDLLDRAREEYRAKMRKKKQQALLYKAEDKMARTMNLRTTTPIRNMFGQIVYNEDGSIARRENHNVLRIQMDVAKFVTERLDPERYGRVDKSENKHLVFSLSELRRQKENGVEEVSEEE